MNLTSLCTDALSTPPSETRSFYWTYFACNIFSSLICLFAIVEYALLRRLQRCRAYAWFKTFMLLTFFTTCTSAVCLAVYQYYIILTEDGYSLFPLASSQPSPDDTSFLNQKSLSSKVFAAYSFFQPVSFLCFVLARLAALQWLLELTGRTPEQPPRQHSSFSLPLLPSSSSAFPSASPHPSRFNSRYLSARNITVVIMLLPLVISIVARWAVAWVYYARLSASYDALDALHARNASHSEQQNEISDIHEAKALAALMDVLRLWSQAVSLVMCSVAYMACAVVVPPRMRSLGDGLLDRLCNAGIMRRPGIDRNAVKEISTFKKLVPISVSILLFSFLFRAIMYLCIAVGNSIEQSPQCDICGACQSDSWLLARWIDNSPRIQVPIYIVCEPLSTLYMIALVRWVVHKNLESPAGRLDSRPLLSVTSTPHRGHSQR